MLHRHVLFYPVFLAAAMPALMCFGLYLRLSVLKLGADSEQDEGEDVAHGVPKRAVGQHFSEVFVVYSAAEGLFRGIRNGSQGRRARVGIATRAALGAVSDSTPPLPPRGKHTMSWVPWEELR